MSEKIKVRIQTSIRMTYDQIVEMRPAVWEIMKKTSEREMEDGDMSPITDFLDFKDPCSWGDFDEPELTVVDDEGKAVQPLDYYCP